MRKKQLYSRKKIITESLLNSLSTSQNNIKGCLWILDGKNKRSISLVRKICLETY